MKMLSNGVEVYILPDKAVCMADEEHHSPLDLDLCPIGNKECNGDCEYYTEDVDTIEQSLLVVSW